jgi:hypothetical protein
MSNSTNSTSDSDSLIVQVDFNSLATSLIIALAVNFCLQGMLCLQVYTYYLAFPHDRIQAKLQVYAVFIFELFQSALVAHDVVIALAPSMLNFRGLYENDMFEALNSLHSQWFTIPLAGGIIGGVGQLFFAYRIWIISNETGPPIAIGILSIASICAALISAAAFFSAKTFTYLLGTNDGFASITAWNGIGAICDISIALSMPYFLMRHGTGLPSTHVLIVRLVRLLIETGGLTAIMAILHVCLFVSHSESFVIPGLCMSKIYATTMLVIFNNRLKISGGRFDQEENEECEFTTSRVSSTRRERRDSRDSRTKVFVSNGRLTFHLATDLPLSPSVASENSPSTNSESVPHTKVDLEA